MNNDIDNQSDCFDNLELFLSKHVGKMAIVLSIIGGISSALIGMKIIVAGSVVMGVCNASIAVGGIAYERLQNIKNNLIMENKNLFNEKIELNRKLTEYKFPTSSNNNDTPQSYVDESSNTEPYEEVINISSKFQK